MKMFFKDRVWVLPLFAIIFCQIAISDQFQWPKDRVTINRSGVQDQSKKSDLKPEPSQQPQEIKVIQPDEAQERMAAGRRRPPVLRLAPPRLRRKQPPPQAEEKLFFNGARGRRRPKRPVHGGYGPPRPQYGPPKHRPRPTFKKTRPKFRGRPQPHGHPKPRYPELSYRQPPSQYSAPKLPVGYPSPYPSLAPLHSDNPNTYGSPPPQTGNNGYSPSVEQDEYGSPKGKPQIDEYGSPLAEAQDGYGSPKAPKQEANTLDEYGGEFNPPSFSISGGNSLEEYGSPSGPSNTISNGAQSQQYQGYDSPSAPTQTGYSSPSNDQSDSYGLPQASPTKDSDGFPVPDFNEYAPSGEPVFDFSNDNNEEIETYSSQPSPSSGFDDDEDVDISFGFPEFPTPNFLSFQTEYTPDFHFDLQKVNRPGAYEDNNVKTSPSPVPSQYQPPSSFQPSYEIEEEDENLDVYESPSPSGTPGANQYNGQPPSNSYPYGTSPQENEVEDTFENGYEPEVQLSDENEAEGGPPVYHPPTTPQSPEPSFVYEKPSLKPDTSSYYKPVATSSPLENQPSSYPSAQSADPYSPPRYSSRQPSIIQEDERQVEYQSYDAPSKAFPSQDFPSQDSGEFYTPNSEEEKEPSIVYTKPFSGSPPSQYSSSNPPTYPSEQSQPFPTSYEVVEEVGSTPYQPHSSQSPPQNGNYQQYEEEEEDFQNQPFEGEEQPPTYSDTSYYKPSSSPQLNSYEQSNPNTPQPSPTPSEVYYKPIESSENGEPSNSNNFYNNDDDGAEEEEVTFSQYQGPSSPSQNPPRESLFGGGFFDFKFPSYDKEINDVSYSFDDKEQTQSSSTENPRYDFASIPNSSEDDSSDDFDFYSSGNARPSSPSETPKKDFGKYKKIPSFAPPNDKFLYKTPESPQSSQSSYSEPFSGPSSVGSSPSSSGNFDSYGSPRAPQRYPQDDEDKSEPQGYSQSFSEEENEAPNQYSSYGSPKAPSVPSNEPNDFKQYSPPSNSGGREKYVRQFNSFPTQSPSTTDRDENFKSRQPLKPSQVDSYGAPEAPVSDEVDEQYTPSRYPSPPSPSYSSSPIEQNSYDSPRAQPTFSNFPESSNSITDLGNQEVVFKYQNEGQKIPSVYSPEDNSGDEFDEQFTPEELKNIEPYSDQSNEFPDGEFSEGAFGEDDFGEDDFNQYSPPREVDGDKQAGAFPPGPSGAIKVIEYDPYSEPDDFPSRFEKPEAPKEESSSNRQRYQPDNGIVSSQSPPRTTKARQRTKVNKETSPTPTYKSRQVYRSRQKNPLQPTNSFEIHEARPSPTPGRPSSTRPNYNQQAENDADFFTSKSPSNSLNGNYVPEQSDPFSDTFQPDFDGKTYYKNVPSNPSSSRSPPYQSKYQDSPLNDEPETTGGRTRTDYSSQNQAWPSPDSEEEYFESEDSEFDSNSGLGDSKNLFKESKSQPEDTKPSRTPYRPNPEPPKTTRTSLQETSYARGRTTPAPDLQSYPAVPDKYSTFNPSPTDDNQSYPKEEEPTRAYKEANPRVSEQFSDDDFIPSGVANTPSRRPRKTPMPTRRSDVPKEEHGDEDSEEEEKEDSREQSAKQLDSLGFGPSTFHFGMDTPDIWEMFNSEWGQKVKSDN